MAGVFEDNWDRLEPVAGDAVGPLRPVDCRELEEAVTALEEVASECDDEDDLP